MDNLIDTQYYMLYVDGKKAPTVKHTDLDAARAEAERICNKENRPVDLLVAVATCNPKGIKSTDDLIKDLLHYNSVVNVDEVADRLAYLQNLVEDAYDILRIKDADADGFDIQKAIDDIKAFRTNAQPFIDPCLH